RAQRTPDQALDFLRAARLLAARGFAVHARVGGARQHAVLRGDPPSGGSFEMRRLPLEHARSAEHARVAEFDEHRAFRVTRISTGETHRSQCVGRPFTGSHVTPGMCYRGWGRTP